MSLYFSVVAGGVRRYIRYVILFCVAIVMVGTMVLTTYTASADSSTMIPLRYNANARAKAKVYYKALRHCYDETGNDLDDLIIYFALRGKWGTDNENGETGDVGENLNDDFLSMVRGLDYGNYDCNKGNLISDAFDYFYQISNGVDNGKRWSQWTLEDKQDLFCGGKEGDGGFFKAAYDGSTNDYDRNCGNDVKVVSQMDFEKAHDYAFVKNDGDTGLSYLKSYINNIILDDSFDVSDGYTEDEYYYVYRGLITGRCNNNKGYLSADPNLDSGYDAMIHFKAEGNALVWEKQWWYNDIGADDLNWDGRVGTAECERDIGNDKGIGSLSDYRVVAAKDTLVDYYKEDCLEGYRTFYNNQLSYKNGLTEPKLDDSDESKEIYYAYIDWFDVLPLPETLNGDDGFCISKGIYIKNTQPEAPVSINPIFECRIDEFIEGLLSTNPDPNSPGWTGYTIPGLINDDSDNNTGTDPDPCYQSAGGLGWAICPIMSSLSNTLTSIYEDMVEPFLAVNPRLLSAEAKSVVDKVSTFANIAIIIFLLVIIFSQLTGVGIDNYGIKKSLPKLIVTVVLVNLSFVICQVAVDLSNIVGSGANSMLSGVDVSITPCNSREYGVSNGVMLNVPGGQQCVPADISSGSEAGMFRALVDIASVGLAGVGAIGVGSIILGVASSGWLAGLIIPVLLLLITAVTAVLFFFVLLGVRQAGVVILAVLSPLALACYMLPNTKRYFDKWKKAFTGLLVLYPICGLLIGGGQLAAKILISASQDYVTYFAGCLIMVVPFFFIPSLLKGSFAAMGNIGAKISGFGKSLGSRGRGRVEGAFKNSDRYKNRVDFNQKRAAERRAERTVKRLGGRRTNLNRRQQARMAAANSVLDERAKRQRENEQKSDLSYRGAMDAKIGLESEESRRNLSDYNNTDFVHAKRTQDRVSHDESVQDALLYNNGDYVSGKLVQKRLSRENDLQGSVLYTRAGFEDSRRQQYEANRRSEVKKMYSERYNNTSAAHRQSELSRALRGNAADPTEQMDAAFDSLMATGDVTEVLNALNGIGGGDLDAMDQGLRDRVLAKAAASGNQLLKGWAKANAGNNPKVGLQDYINNINNDFSQYLNTQAGEHVFDNADKDTLRFLASHGGGAALSGQILSNILTTSANTSGVAKQAALDLIRDREAEIGNLISAEGLTKISPEIAGQLGRINLTNAINDIGRSGNEQLRAKVNPEVARILGI